MNQSINDGGDRRTAPATLGLLITLHWMSFILLVKILLSEEDFQALQKEPFRNSFDLLLHCTLYTLQYKLYTLHCTLYTTHCTLFTQCAMPCAGYPDILPPAPRTRSGRWAVYKERSNICNNN